MWLQTFTDRFAHEEEKQQKWTPLSDDIETRNIRSIQVLQKYLLFVVNKPKKGAVIEGFVIIDVLIERSE